MHKVIASYLLYPSKRPYSHLQAYSISQLSELRLFNFQGTGETIRLCPLALRLFRISCKLSYNLSFKMSIPKSKLFAF